MYFTFKALAGKLNLDKECVPNFALFEIMEYDVIFFLKDPKRCPHPKN